MGRVGRGVDARCDAGSVSRFDVWQIVSRNTATGDRAGAGERPSRPTAADDNSTPTERTPVTQYNSPEALARMPHFAAAGNRFLFFWMFRFLRPVKWIVVAACVWLALAVAVEISVAKWIEKAVNLIQKLSLAGEGAAPSFWQWFWRDRSKHASDFRIVMLVLVGLIVAALLLRYLKEVANTKMSMHLVFFIREAVYDKLQRVGFGFHDSLSSGQLINRALSDLQNVRAFIQTAVLTTLDIVLAVGGYIILLITIDWRLALLSLVPLPIWTYYILRFSKIVQPAAKAVMEAEDKNVSLITEAIAGVHVIKAFATETQEIKKYDTNVEEFLKRTLKRIRLFADFNPGFMENYANILLHTKKADKVLCGWVEYFNEEYKAFLYLVGTEGETGHTKEALETLYKK